MFVISYVMLTFAGELIGQVTVVMAALTILILFPIRWGIGSLYFTIKVVIYFTLSTILFPSRLFTGADAEHYTGVDVPFLLLTFGVLLLEYFYIYKLKRC